MNKMMLSMVFMISGSISATCLATQYFEPRTPEEIAEGMKVMQAVNDNMDLIKKYPYTKSSIEAADAFVSTFRFFQANEPSVFKTCDTLIGSVASKFCDLGVTYYLEIFTPENEKIVCEILNRNIASVEGDCKKFVKETLEPFAKQTLLPAFEKLKTELDASLGDKSPKFQAMINNFEKEINAELVKPENKESLDEISGIYTVACESAEKVFKKYFNKKKNKKINA